MLKTIFERPRNMVAAVGGLIALQGTIFRIIEPSLFSTSAITIGIVLALAGLQVPIRQAWSKLFDQVKDQLTRLAEERKRVAELAAASAQMQESPTVEELPTLEVDDGNGTELPTLQPSLSDEVPIGVSRRSMKFKQPKLPKGFKVPRVRKQKGLIASLLSMKNPGRRDARGRKIKGFKY